MAFTLKPGDKIPEFELEGSDGQRHSYDGVHPVRGPKGTLIVFTCNHCPYVIGSEARMKDLFAFTSQNGISFIAVHSNETDNHPTDAWPLVLERMKTMGFGWLSLNDHTQIVARAFGAQRTPHYFLFDSKGVLVYVGRMDNSPRDVTKLETRELQDALDDYLAERPIRLSQTDAIGCNVKWWDKEKHWMPGDACDLDYLYTRNGLSAPTGG
jgi:peroxiredoxin